VVLATVVLKPLAEIGAAVHIAAHAFGKITLFFAAGAIYTASHKTELWQLAGIGRRMPWTMAAFTIGALSMIGVPPTAGFVSKWFILAGAFQAESYLAIFTIIASTALNAMYFLPIVYFAWLSPPATGVDMKHGEAPLAILLALMVTAALTILFFFFNQPLLDLEGQLVRSLSL
jgi:multicomponent Na+:H+ antiporter subunit D